MNTFGTPEYVGKFSTSEMCAQTATEFPLFWGEKINPYSWVANTFEREVPERIRLVPLEHDETWRTVGDLVTRFKPKEVLGVFAPFLQIDNPFDRAIQALGMNTFCVAEERVRMAVATIEELQIGGIVLTQPAFAETLELVQTLSLSVPPYFQVVLGANERAKDMRAMHRIFYEIHLVPGMVGLFQCEHLAGSAELFHLNYDFVWEHEDQALLVTDIRHHRFQRALFPRAVLLRESTCSCGANTTVILQ